jgi:light-regulated signal transduction histidine kinase (bacteriophytochrome)
VGEAFADHRAKVKDSSCCHPQTLALVLRSLVRTVAQMLLYGVLLSTGLRKPLRWIETYGKLNRMSDHRIVQAVQRIEAALTRISDVADSINPAAPSVTNLVEKHESLREIVSNSLKKLDDLLERLER